MIESQLPIHYIPTDNSLLNFASQISPHSHPLHQDSFFLLNLSDIHNKIKIWQEAIPTLNLYHDISKYCDYNFLRFLLTSNVGLSCNTKNDLVMVTKHSNQRKIHLPIIYNGECKLPAHLKLACTNDINLITFSTNQELERITKNHSNAKLIMNVTFHKDLHFPKLVQNVLELLILATEYKENIIGLCVNVPEEDNLSGLVTQDNIKFYSTLFNYIFEILKISFNLGYTFPNIYFDMPNFGVFKNNEEFKKFASHFNDLLDNMMLIYPCVKHIFATATSYLFSSTHTSALCTPILSVIKPDEGSNDNQLLFVNNGVYDAFLYQSLSEAYSIDKTVQKKHLRVRKLSQSTDYSEQDDMAKNKESTIYDIYGSTGKEEDRIGVNYHLPSTIAAGDWLIFYFVEENMTNFKYDSSIKSIFIAREDLRQFLESQYIFDEMNDEPKHASLKSQLYYDMEYDSEDKSEELELYFEYLFSLNSSNSLNDLPRSKQFFITNEF